MCNIFTKMLLLTFIVYSSCIAVFGLGPQPPLLHLSSNPPEQNVTVGEGAAVYELHIQHSWFSGWLNITLGSKLVEDLGGSNIGYGDIPSVEPLPDEIELYYWKQTILVNGSGDYFIPVSVKVPSNFSSSKIDLVILVYGEYKHEFGHNESLFAFTNVRLNVEPKTTITETKTTTETESTTTSITISLTTTTTFSTTIITTTTTTSIDEIMDPLAFYWAVAITILAIILAIYLFLRK